jgi:zinc ribbon protein
VALIKCKECGNEISSDAKACPNCGKPIVKTTSAAQGCLVLIVLVGALALIGHCSSSPDASKPQLTPVPTTSAPPISPPAASAVPEPPVPAVKAKTDKAILNNAKALDEKYGIDASVYCGSDADDYLRKASKFAFQWDKIGFFEEKFDKYLTHVSSPGVLTVVSDKVSLQNGFGAYERVELYCDYDTQKKKAQGFSINGRP